MSASVIRTGGVRVFISQEFRKNLASLSRQLSAGADRRFQFDKRGQLFIRTHRASTIQIVRPSESMAKTQPQLQPDLLSVSAMISQYFTEWDCASLMFS